MYGIWKIFIQICGVSPLDGVTRASPPPLLPLVTSLAIGRGEGAGYTAPDASDEDTQPFQ